MRKLASFMGLMLLILTTSIFTSCKEPKPEPKVYAVTFDAAGGSEVAAIQVKSGEKAVQPEEPTKEGYVFDAWYNGDVEYDWETPVTANLTLTAKWTDKTYTVTFDVEGIEAQEVKHKDKVTKPEDPTKDGCTFAGWYNGEDKYDFESLVTSDLELKAEWDVVKYSITFDVEGVKAIEVEHGKVVEEPAAPTKDGYTFKGWMNGETAYDWTKAVTASVELKASWEATKYTITYLPEGIETDNPKEYTIESEEITLKDPTKAPDAAKPNFVQWRAEKEDGDGVTKIEKGSTGNKTFYAEYTDKKTFKVTFMDGDKAVGEALTVIEGEKVKLPTDYAKYDLYSDKECKTAFDATTAITANTTIYVKVKTFTVTFDSDGGSEVKAITVNYGEAAKKPADPKKEGDVKFNGWYNGDKAYDWTTKVTNNLTLKAKWKALETYTVTFDSDGGSSVESKTVKEGQKATEPEKPTKEGYTFGYWFVEGEKTAYDFNKAVTSNLKLKAAWDKKIFSITLNGSDGIKEDPSIFEFIKLGYGDEVTQALVEKTLKDDIPTRAGYKFTGWKVTEELPFTVIEAKTINVTAQWAKLYAVTFDGGEPIYVEEGSKVTKPADPTKEGFVFAGWLNGETAYDFELPVTSDLVLTAKWDVAKYSITFDVEGVKAIEVEYGKTAEKPADPTRDGCSFLGWYNGDIKFDFSNKITSDLTLVAKWGPKYLVAKGDLELEIVNEYNQANLPGFGVTYSKGDLLVTGGTVTIDGVETIKQMYMQVGTEGGTVTKQIGSSWIGADSTTTELTFYFVYKFTEDVPAVFGQIACEPTSGTLTEGSKITIKDFYAVHLPNSVKDEFSLKIAEEETATMNFFENKNDGNGYKLDIQSVNFNTIDGKIVCLYTRPEILADYKHHYINGGYVAKDENGYTACYPSKDAQGIFISKDVVAGNTCYWFQIGIAGQNTSTGDTLEITNLEVRILPHF